MKRPALVIVLGALTVAIAMGAGSRSGCSCSRSPPPCPQAARRSVCRWRCRTSCSGCRCPACRRPDRSAVGGRGRPVRGGIGAAVAGGLDGHAVPGPGGGRLGAEGDLVRGDPGRRGADLRHAPSVVSVRDCLPVPPGRQLPGSLARRPHLRRYRLLQPGLDRRDRAGCRRGDRAPADQGSGIIGGGPAEAGAVPELTRPGRATTGGVRWPGSAVRRRRCGRPGSARR